MAIKQLKIVFADFETNPEAVYFSGQPMKFHVDLVLTEPIKCKGVGVQVYGEAFILWKESRSTTDSDGTTTTELEEYTWKDNYIDQKVKLFESKSCGPDAGCHPAGEFLYPAAYHLQQTLPSSFEGGVGRIRYFVKATLYEVVKEEGSQTCKTIGRISKRYFTVIRPLDLTAMLADQVGPFSIANEYSVNMCLYFGCFCGFIQARLQLDKRGFVPGEAVTVRGSIVNTSQTTFDAIKFKIRQVCTFTVGSKTNTTNKVASETTLPGLGRGQTLELCHELPVKPVASSFAFGCSNIDIRYFLQIKACSGLLTSSKETLCELVIGTVPMTPATQPTAPPLDGSGVPAVVTSQPQSAVPIPLWPTFEECVFGKQVMTDGEGSGVASKMWAPSYPVYIVPTAPPAV